MAKSTVATIISDDLRAWLETQPGNGISEKLRFIVEDAHRKRTSNVRPIHESHSFRTADRVRREFDAYVREVGQFVSSVVPNWDFSERFWPANWRLVWKRLVPQDNWIEWEKHIADKIAEQRAKVTAIDVKA